MSTPQSENFYNSIDSFNSFDGITSDDNFHTVPDDWVIFVTDVKDSTKAIEEGRYRDVNKLGAGSVAVVRRNVKDTEFPYVFDGDGAILVVPPELEKTSRKELSGLRDLASENFKLDLRVGSVTVEDVVKNNYEIEVAKFELAAERSISVFRGGGLGWVETQIKQNREKYAISEEPKSSIELEGLSCRWQAIPSDRGNILSIIIVSHADNDNKLYSEILKEFDQIIDGGFDRANPINTDDMVYESFWNCLTDEIRYHNSILTISFLMRFLEIILAITVFKIGINPTSIDDDEYLQSLRTHSDYRKFYDNLRLIVDSKDGEAEKIKNYLNDLKDDGRISYGIHESSESFMTCYVDDLGDGGHIHFIDGGQGGYALAAEQLKSQLNDSELKSSFL